MSVKASKPMGGEPAAVLTEEEARQQCRVSRTTWFRWKRAGLVPKPVIQIGRVTRYRKADIAALLEGGAE